MKTQGVGTFSIAGTTARLPGRALLDSRDPDETTTVVGGLLSEHVIRVQGPTSQFHAEVRDCAVGDLWLAHFKYGTTFTVESEPLGRYVINFTINGLSQTRHGGASAAAEAGQATAFSPREPTELTWSPGTEVLSLVVPTAAVEEHFRQLSGVGTGEIAFDVPIRADEAHLLRATIGSALRASGGGLGDLPEAVSWQMRNAILTAMLLELPHDRSELLTRLRDSGSTRLCAAATALMRQHLATPTPIPKIAAQLGVSERSLQVTFREELHTTPSASFKRLRLEAVRDALLRLDPEGTTVTEVAVDVGGFFNLGRMAREYHEMFGEHPSDTLRRPLS